MLSAVVCVMFVPLVLGGLGCVAQVLFRGGVVACVIVFGEVMLVFVICVEFRLFCGLLCVQGIFVRLELRYSCRNVLLICKLLGYVYI